jgi:hypothetical protein
MGPQGPAGPTGPTGPTGATGATGAGVPAGGTAGQVLTKVDGTDFNTQWTDAASGGGLDVQLFVTPTVSQTISALAGAGTSTRLEFSQTNPAGAQLTGGNTWNGSVFTVGAQGAGWYQITAATRGVQSNGSTLSAVGVLPLLDINDAMLNTDNNPSAIGVAPFNTAMLNTRNSGYLSKLVFLSAGQTVEIQGIGISTSTPAVTSTDGNTYLLIEKRS